jgi:hypothetical protein
LFYRTLTAIFLYYYFRLQIADCMMAHPQKRLGISPPCIDFATIEHADAIPPLEKVRGKARAGI